MKHLITTVLFLFSAILLAPGNILARQGEDGCCSFDTADEVTVVVVPSIETQKEGMHKYAYPCVIV
jgi:hypothetical protein